MAKLLLVLLTFTAAKVPRPQIRPTSWNPMDDNNWDATVEVPKGPGSSKNVLAIPGSVGGLLVKCNASYPVEWIFHHSQLPAHSAQRSSRGRWWIAVSTIRKSDDLNDPSSFEYLSILRLTSASNGVTGNYTCQKVGDESVSRSVYVYWEGTSPPFLIQQGQNTTAILDPTTKVAQLLCTVARSDVQVKLYKGKVNVTSMIWTELKLNTSIAYDPKRGYTLTNLSDPLGPYKCIANSDDKDTTTVHVIPSTSPEAKPLEFGDILKPRTRFGFDSKTLRLFCCSRPDSPPPSMMHFYCEHPTTCRNRKNALLYMENTAVRNGSCSFVRLPYQIAGIFRCVGDGINIIREYFFPMGTQFGFAGQKYRNPTPGDPFFSWSSADPLKMISLRVLSNKIYVGQNVTFGCQVSNYYFSKGTRWVIGFKNGSHFALREALLNTTGRGRSQYFRLNILSLVLNIDRNLEWVGCYAPVWNTSEWKNQHVPVVALEPAKPQIVSGDMSPTVVDWYLNDTRKYFDCESTGDPAPIISWRKDGKRFYRYKTLNTNQSSSKTISRINITRVSYETHGEYTCTARNLAGTVTKTFKVIVHERMSTGVIVTIIISVIALVMAFGGLVYLAIRVKNQKVIINKLAASSFDVPTTGGGSSTDGTPTNPSLTSGNPRPGMDIGEHNDGKYHRM